MTPTGHKFTAASLALALSAPFISESMFLECAVMFAAVMFGARAPDWTEIARWENGVRKSVIPHRGPTHWPGWWAIGLFIAFQYPAPEPLINVAMKGFFASALLHLLMDIMTPTGIPLLHPFAKKRSLNIYKTGSFFSEATLSLLCWGAAILWTVEHISYFSSLF